MTIAPNKFVALDYELYVGDENERILMEQTTPDRPLEYIQGMGMMLPAFEKQLFGLKAGDKFDFVLKCEDAYGEPSDEAVQELPREIFVDSEGKLDALVVEGATLPLHTPDGQIIRGSVLEIKDEVVVFDFNHPLAGEDLHFIGTIKTSMMLRPRRSSSSSADMMAAAVAATMTTKATKKVVAVVAVAATKHA